MNSSVLSILGGVSTAIGLIAIIAYLYSTIAIKAAASESIKEIIGINSSFDANQIIGILKEFKDDQSKIQALRKLTQLDKEKATLLAGATHNNPSLRKIIADQHLRKINALRISGAVFLLMGISGIAAGYRSGEKIIAPTNLQKKIHQSQALPDLRDWKNIKAQTRADIEVNGASLDFVSNGHFVATLEPSAGSYSSANVVLKNTDDLVRTFCVSAILENAKDLMTVEIGSKDGLLIVGADYSWYGLYETQLNQTDKIKMPEDISSRRLQLCFEDDYMTAFLGGKYLGSLKKEKPYEAVTSPAGAFFKAFSATGGKVLIKELNAHRLSKSEPIKPVQ